MSTNVYVNGGVQLLTFILESLPVFMQRRRVLGCLPMILPDPYILAKITLSYSYPSKRGSHYYTGRVFVLFYFVFV